MMKSPRTKFSALRKPLVIPLFCAVLAILLVSGISGCSSSTSSSKDRMAEETGGWEERREAEEEEDEREKAPTPPPAWSEAEITIEPVEWPGDEIRFHIGSPVFLRLKVADPQGCTPFAGTPFYFDAPGSQLGWGFREVSDSLLFPRQPGSCERFVMLSSDNSNRVAEGEYSFKLQLFMDASNRINSDTVSLVAIRSAAGADTLSYARFLQEQIINNSPLLADPETRRALFSEGTPRSAESEVYRAIILYRGGDMAGAEEALISARSMQDRRGRSLNRAAAAARDALAHSMGMGASSR